MSYWEINIIKFCLKSDSPLTEKAKKIIEYWVNKELIKNYKIKKFQNNEWTIMEFEYEYDDCFSIINDELGSLGDIWSEVKSSDDGSYIIEFYDSDYGVQVGHTGSVHEYEITDFEIVKDIKWESGEAMDFKIKLPLKTWLDVTGCENAEEIEDVIYDNEEEVLKKIFGKDLFRTLYKYDEYEIFEMSDFDVENNIVTFGTHNIWNGLTLNELFEFRENFYKAVELLKYKNGKIHICSEEATYKDDKSIELNDTLIENLTNKLKQIDDDKNIAPNTQKYVEIKLPYEGENFMFYYIVIETGFNYMGDIKVYGYKQMVG